jgi:hypothetical protein
MRESMHMVMWVMSDRDTVSPRSLGIAPLVARTVLNGRRLGKVLAQAATSRKAV